MKHLVLIIVAATLLALPAWAAGEDPQAGDSPAAGDASEMRDAQGGVSLSLPMVSRFRIPKEMSLCGEPVPLERMDVRERLEMEAYYILDRQGLLIMYLKRAARTNPIVEVILEMEGLPNDLKYVPVAESGLAFRATSSAKAVGYWQFMEYTARRYGLKIDPYIDERRDLTRSTLAAAAYLKHLHEMFGSWAMALAAYNWGEGNVGRATKEQGTTCYYDLYLPEETERYVFRILALKLFMEDPRIHSIDIPEEELYVLPKVMEVEIQNTLPLTVEILASSANVGARTIRVLNPWIRQNVLPAGKYLIAVPAEEAEGYADRVAQRLAGRKKIVHTVEPGESISTIASSYKVPVEAIEKWNNLSGEPAVLHGQKLTIWQ